MTEILVIQNAAIEGIGQLGKMLESDGYTLKTINAKQEKIPQKKFPFLIIFRKNIRSIIEKPLWCWQLAVS